MVAMWGRLTIFAVAWCAACTVPNPALCYGPDDCPGGFCDPELQVCVMTDASVPREDYIAFVSRRDGNDEIYRMKADGSEQINLTNNPSADTSPLWDPTGERIAFLSDRDGLVQLFVMNLDGAGTVRVSGGEATEPTWSPDGQALAFTSSRTGRPELWRVAIDGSSLVQLTTTGGSGADWSSDDRIVFVGPSSGIAVMDGDGTGQTVIVSAMDVPMLVTPRWKPDRSKIAAYTRFGQNVWVFNADGGDLLDVTNPPGYAQIGPRWAPTRDELLVTDLVAPGLDVWVLDAGGAATRNLTMTPDDSERAPDWGPDGDSVLFTSDRGGNTDVYRVSRDGGNAINLTEHASDDFDARWRPAP
jgi:Tol biopolymer transport system component